MWTSSLLICLKDLNFRIVNSPFICDNIPAAPAYGVYISQWTRYYRDRGSYHDFHDRGLLLTRKLLNKVFLLVKLNASEEEQTTQWPKETGQIGKQRFTKHDT
jgi:hypothetical protein